MLSRLFWIVASTAFFSGGLAFGLNGLKSEPGSVATALEPLLW